MSAKKTAAKKTASKKTAKKGTRRVPPPNPAQPVDASFPAYVAPAERSVQVNNSATLLSAMNRCRPVGKGGNPNKCWTALTHEERMAIAGSHITDGLSEDRIRAKYADVCKRGGISKGSMERFLREVRTAYQSAYDARLGTLTEVDAAAFATGDLPAMLGLVYGRLAPKFIENGLMLDKESSATDMHPILRFMEGMSAAAKVQSDAKHKELSSVLLAIRAEAAGGKRVKSNADQDDSTRRIVDLVDRFLRGEAA